MGSNSSKPGKNKPTELAKLMRQSSQSNALDSLDYEFLTAQTGFSLHDIKRISDKFKETNSDGKLNKTEFIKFYAELNSEKREMLDKIAEFVFKCFDKDNNESITFNEFIVIYISFEIFIKLKILKFFKYFLYS